MCILATSVNMTKILFLDIDGVLNSAHVLDTQKRGDAIDRDMVSRINHIIDATGCKIVISSTWRLYHSLFAINKRLTSEGMHDNLIIGKTPRLDAHYYNRADEILRWLKDNDDVTQYIAIDDSAGEFDKIRDHLVATTWKDGLQDIHVTEAINKLNNGTIR